MESLEPLPDDLSAARRAAWEGFRTVLGLAGVERVEGAILSSVEANHDGLKGATIQDENGGYAVTVDQDGLSFQVGDDIHRISHDTATVAILDYRINSLS